MLSRVELYVGPSDETLQLLGSVRRWPVRGLATLSFHIHKRTHTVSLLSSAEKTHWIQCYRAADETRGTLGGVEKCEKTKIR